MAGWVQILLALIGAPAAWEFLKWFWGFARKQDYLAYAEGQHIRDLKRANQSIDKLEKKLDDREERLTALIKESMELNGENMRLRVELEHYKVHKGGDHRDEAAHSPD
jgi:hypothetical protein